MGLKEICSKAKKVADFIYTDIYYTVGYGCVIGAGNGFASKGRFDHGFGEGFMNNFYAGIFLNAIYPAAFNLTKKSKHFRTCAHLVNFGMNAAFLAWHYYAGTENPLAGCLPAYAIGTVMTEKCVSDIKNNQVLEDIVKKE